MDYECTWCISWDWRMSTHGEEYGIGRYTNNDHTRWMFQPSMHISYMGWLQLVSSLKLQVSFAKEPCKTHYILQKRPIDLRSLLIVAISYEHTGWTSRQGRSDSEVWDWQAYLCMNIHTCTHVHMYTCTHVHMLMHTYTHAHTHVWSVNVWRFFPFPFFCFKKLHGIGRQAFVQRSEGEKMMKRKRGREKRGRCSQYKEICVSLCKCVCVYVWVCRVLSLSTQVSALCILTHRVYIYVMYILSLSTLRTHT